MLHGCPLSLDAELNIADHADRRNFLQGREVEQGADRMYLPATFADAAWRRKLTNTYKGSGK